MSNPSELQRDSLCPVCAQPREWKDCLWCGGDGLDGEEPNVSVCPDCLGSRGWWECLRCLAGVEGE